MKIIYSALLLLFTNVVIAQEYWISPIFSDRYDESHELIKTSDGGFLAVGTKNTENLDTLSQDAALIKFDENGNLTWEQFYAISPPQAIRLDIGIAVVELDGSFFFATSSTSNISIYGSITEVDQNGQIIQSITKDLYDINDLLLTQDGNLLAIYYDFLSDAILVSKMDRNFEVIWETPIENAVFALFESHTSIDDQGQIQLWLVNSENENEVNGYTFSPEGEIIKDGAYPSQIPGFISGVASAKVSANEVAFIPQGNAESNDIQLSLANLDDQSIINTFEITQYLKFIEEVKVVEDRIYVLGQAQEENWPAITVLEKDLSFVRTIYLKDIIQANDGTDLVENAALLNMNVDENNNLVISGFIVFQNTSFGTINGFINKLGNFEFISSVETSKNTLPLSIYPNPTTDYFSIEQAMSQHSSLAIYSVTGQKVLTKNNIDQHEKIDIQSLSKGEYTILVKSQDSLFSSLLVVE